MPDHLNGLFSPPLPSPELAPIVRTIGTPEMAVLVEGIKELVDGVALLVRLREQRLDDGLCWILPPDMLPTVTALYGLPVHHVDVPHPMLGHRIRT